STASSGGATSGGSSASSGSGSSAGSSNGSASGPKTIEVQAAPASGTHVAAAGSGASSGGAAAGPERTPYLVYAGAGVALLGMALVGGGAFEGLDAKKAYKEANDKDANGDPIASQPKATQLKKQGDTSTER